MSSDDRETTEDGCSELDSLYRQSTASSRIDQVRALHAKAPLYNMATDCEVCSDEDEEVQERHEQVEGPDGDFLCASVVVGHCCGHCTNLHEYSEETVSWPCKTAQIVYTPAEFT